MLMEQVANALSDILGIVAAACPCGILHDVFISPLLAPEERVSATAVSVVICYVVHYDSFFP